MLVSETVLAVVASHSPPVDLPSRLPGAPPALVVDDGSSCSYDSVLRQLDTAIETLRLPRNRGIAAALNVGLRRARELGAGWLLTLDQDSRLGPGSVAALLATATRCGDAGVPVGVVGCGMVSTGGTAMHYRTHEVAPGVLGTDEVLQSGALWNVAALTRLGGFDESLAIDGVDTEMCLRLSENGYAVLVAPDARLEHELGRAVPVRLLGREILATGHSPRRRRTIVRNRLRLAPRHLRADPVAGLIALRRMAVGLTVDAAREPRLAPALLGAAALGTVDAMRGQTGLPR